MAQPQASGSQSSSSANPSSPSLGNHVLSGPKDTRHVKVLCNIGRWLWGCWGAWPPERELLILTLSCLLALPVHGPSGRRVLQASVLLPIICRQDKCGKCFQSLADCSINCSLHGGGQGGEGQGKRGTSPDRGHGTRPCRGRVPGSIQQYPGLPQHHRAGGQDSEIAVLGNLAPWRHGVTFRESHFFIWLMGQQQSLLQKGC